MAICCTCICYVQFFKRSRSVMELSYFINLIFIFALNVLFFFSGICLNSVVILSFWRSVQLRKKLCYFMIMVLSCCDLLVVSIHNPLLAVCTMLWLNGKLDVYRSWVLISNRVTSLSVSFSLLALLVMNFDRYLATSYPIFHRTSVTKRKLLTLLAILIIVQLTLALMSVNFVISFQVHILIFIIIVIPPMVFINYKLFAVARKSRRNNGISPEMKRTFSLKNISSCLLAVACLAVLSIPVFVYLGLRITSKYDASVLDNGQIAAFWVGTIISMNSTFNCLIFFWKNKILRTEGMKVIKGMKICLKP
jgi:hypothetical protein